MAFFGEVFRVLTGGGCIVTATDNETTIRRRALSPYYPETIEPELQRYPQEGEICQLLSAAGFEAIEEETVESDYELSDAASFERKTFSCIHLSSDEAFLRGLAQLKQDLQHGPVAGTSRYVVYRARKTFTGLPSHVVE